MFLGTPVRGKRCKRIRPGRARCLCPFGDGNGRTSRLMTNFVPSRHGSPVPDMGYGHRSSYYSALEKSQDGELPFLKRFVKIYVREHRRLL